MHTQSPESQPHRVRMRDFVERAVRTTPGMNVESVRDGVEHRVHNDLTKFP